MPLFIRMTFKEKVKNIVDEVLETRQNLFLINLTVSDANKINVVIDGDKGVTLQDCIDVSRSVESRLDEEGFEFSIDVASAGVSSPLKLVRQYKKNVGRKLKVKTISQGEIEGMLVEADDEGAVLSWKAREPKEVGKGKVTVEKTLKIVYKDIKESIVIISF